MENVPQKCWYFEEQRMEYCKTAFRGNLPTNAQTEEAISHLQLAAVVSVDLVNGLSLGLLDVVPSNEVGDAAGGHWRLQRTRREMPGANAAVNSGAGGCRGPAQTSMRLQCATEAEIPNASRHQALEGTRTLTVNGVSGTWRTCNTVGTATRGR
ncbi:unnamed protein product [Leuciscus chuanchicus]